MSDLTTNTDSKARDKIREDSIMPAIADFPPAVKEALEECGPAFTNEPERKHFAEYLTGLMIAHKKNVSAINREFAVTTDQSCLNRWAREVEWDEEAFSNQRLDRLQRSPYMRYSQHGGALNITGQSEVTVNACQFKGNYTEGDDGGAFMVAGLARVTLNDCVFDGNYAVSPDATQVDGKDGDAGHVKTEGNSASAITPGTTLIANRCDFLNGSAEDDAGAIQQQGVGSVVGLDACWFEGNKAYDNATVLHLIHNLESESTVTNCFFLL
jgi:hypothetical protein